jgi:hypothetical protein
LGQKQTLNPVAQHELLVAWKLVQLQNHIDRQVLQLRQKVVAFGHAFSLSKNSAAARACKRVKA